jgi:hypothetical protein
MQILRYQPILCHITIYLSIIKKTIVGYNLEIPKTALKNHNGTGVSSPNKSGANRIARGKASGSSSGHVQRLQHSNLNKSATT